MVQVILLLGYSIVEKALLNWDVKHLTLLCCTSQILFLRNAGMLSKITPILFVCLFCVKKNYQPQSD